MPALADCTKRMQERWSAVDRYIDDTLIMQDDALRHALETSAAAGMPNFNVTPAQGKMLHLMAIIAGAKRILEIGTLGGYSAIWFARALPPDGRLTTIEHNWKYVDLSRANIAHAGLTDKVEVIHGKGLDVLPKLQGPFDLIFIDADKPGNPEYFQWAMKLSRPGTTIIVDNTVRGGGISDPNSEDSSVQGTRRMNELIKAEPRVSATTIQTVGDKGYDGFTLIRVLS
jgi:predicted O-methyltransferase YrrM